jgi:eukaryotic-like serine/threonine-protein kinase
MSTRTVRGARVFRFGEFELEARTGQLRRSGEHVRLQEQPYRILLMLLEHPGEVVLREEIRKRLWPNDTVVEVSHGINAAVLRLREALGETAEDPRHIETVARKGYRFRGPVEMIYPERAAPRSSSVDTASFTGQTLSHFRIKDRLGVGGMGVVYRAEDLKLGRDVAVKFLPADQTADPVALRRFEREARTASVLNHPNVCTVHSVEELAGQPAIVMELLEGETLEARLKSGAMAAADALALAIPIASAMEAAHRKGIVHRDLKPANVVVTANGVKVVDFGLAKTGRAPHVTQDGAVLGTPSYMAPEQAMGEEASAASDIYSFGVMLREMLGGAGGEPLKRVVARCLERDPENRWHSAADLKAALELIASAGSPEQRRRLPTRLPKVPSVTGVAAGLAALAALVVWGPISRKPSQIKIAAPRSTTAGRLAVSPDGERIAYNSGNLIWVHSLSRTQPVPVEGSEGAGTPFWSPDGKSLAFAAGGKLKTVPVAGGMPRTIGSVNTNIAGTWTRGGEILIGQVGDGIFRIPATGGELVRVTTPDPAKAETRHILPQMLPDGRRFLYVAGSNKPGESVLWAATMNGAERRPIMNVQSDVILATPRRGRAGYLLHVRDHMLMAETLDLETLERTAPARSLAPAVGSSPTIGSSVAIGDFAAGGATLAYRASPLPESAPMMPVQFPSPMRKVSNEITVLRDWM